MEVVGLNTLVAHLASCKEQSDIYKTGYWSSLNEYPIMYALTAIYDVARVLECGTCSGCSALSWAVGQKSAGKTPEIHTFDPADRNKVYTDTPWAQFIHFNNESWIGSRAKKLLDESVNGATLVFIDGNHQEEACYADAVQTFERVTPGDVVVFHDAVKYQPIQTAISRAITDTAVDVSRRYTIPSACGMEIVEF